MLRSLDSVLGSRIVASDGEIGKVYNILFDDRSWAVRYLVVETGSWFERKKVLLSPAVLGRSDLTEEAIPVFLTKEQVQSSPDVDAERPVSRQQELATISHYDWPDTASTAPDLSTREFRSESTSGEDPHLRSAKEVAGYDVKASDAPLGNVVDFILDDEKWGLVDLVVNPGLSASGHKTLVPTRWVSSLSWRDRRVQLSEPHSKCTVTGL